MVQVDLLRDVLSSAENRKYLSPVEVTWPTFTLISWRTFSLKNAQNIRVLQNKSYELFGVKLAVIGGGYGCTKIVFSVEAATHEEASKFVLNIIDKPAFRELAVEAEFRVAIVSKPYIRTDLRTGDQELSPDAEQAKLEIHARELTLMKIINNVSNIQGGVSGSNLSIGSKGNTMQLSHQPDQNEIAKLLCEIRSEIRQDKALPENEKTEALDLVEVIEEETKKEEPKRALLKSCSDSLKSISCIGESVLKLIGIIGLGS